MKRRQIALVALIAAGLALTAASGAPGLTDPDGFSHLAYARRLWESGLSLRGHPFLPFTILGQTGIDPWWGFHWLLLPFIPFGDLWGARIAGAVIAGVSMAALAWAISKLAPKAPWWLALAPLSVGVFVIRFQSARPGQLSCALILIELVCGAGFASPALALFAAFAHALIHLSAPISPAFALLGFLGARWGKERGSSRAVLWSLGGLSLGFLVRPDRGEILAEGLSQTLRVFGVGMVRLPHSSVEVSERGLSMFLAEAWPLFALVAAALVLGFFYGRAGSRAARTAALLAALATCAMMIFALRFVDYAAACLALYAATLWPAEGIRLQRNLAIACALSLLLLLPSRISRAWEVGHHFYDEPAAFERIAAAARQALPPGAVIFTDDAWVTQILLSVLPEHRYLVAYDPVLLYLGSPADFWRWHHAVTEGIDCAAEQCPGMQPSGAAVQRVLEYFGAESAITSFPRGKLSMQEVMGRDPARFDLLEVAPGQAYGLYLWKIRRDVKPAPAPLPAGH